MIEFFNVHDSLLFAYSFDTTEGFWFRIDIYFDFEIFIISSRYVSKMLNLLSGIEFFILYMSSFNGVFQRRILMYKTGYESVEIC